MYRRRAQKRRATAQQAGAAHTGSKVPGTIVASSQTDMVVAGDDGIERKKSGVGVNKRTAAYAGGGAVLGAIVGAIAGSGKGAAIGAGSGAGLGALTQVLTKGGAIKVPAESVLTFRQDKPLRVTATQ